MNDAHLWKQLCQSDQKAFKALYDRLAEDILSYGYKLCRDKSLVEDALQEVFVSCWEKRHSLPPVANVKSYLFTAIRNRLYRKMKSSPSWDPLEDGGNTLFNLDIRIDPDAFDDIPDRGNLITKVKSMVEQLSDRQKEIVYLKYFEGMDYKEIEQIMGLEYQSLRNLMAKALKNLRKLGVVVYWILFFS